MVTKIAPMVVDIVQDAPTTDSPKCRFSPISMDNVIVGVHLNSKVARLTSIIMSPHYVISQMQKPTSHDEPQDVQITENITTASLTSTVEEFGNKDDNSATPSTLATEEHEISENIEENDFIPVRRKRRDRPRKMCH